MTAISINSLEYTWPGAAAPTLKVPEFKVARGESVFLRGASGSGKSTLLSLMSGILAAPANSVQVLDTDLSELSVRKRDRFRAKHIGIVFQQFNLIPYLSVLDNVLLAAHFGHGNRQLARSGALDLLARVNLTEDLHNRSASELSIGQQQRVAIVRSLINSPQLLLVDEPTSALDHANRDAFLGLLFEVVQASRCAMVFVSHDPSIAASFERKDNIADLNRSGVPQ